MVPGLKNFFNCVSHPAVIFLPHKLVFILESQAETRFCDVGSWVHPRLSGVLQSMLGVCRDLGAAAADRFHPGVGLPARANLGHISNWNQA